MALLFMDSFDHYATADRLEKWSIGGAFAGTGCADTITAAVGRRSSAAWRWVTGSATVGGYLRRILTPTGTTAVMGFALSYSATSSTGIQIASFQDGSTAQVSLRLNTNGTLSVMRGTQAGTVLGTTSTVITAGVFAYLEWKVLIDNTVGTADLRLNGVSLAPFPLTGLNTRNTAVAQWSSVVIGMDVSAAVTTSRTLDYDDLYVLDGNGAAPWNTFLGDCRVDPRYPTAEGASSAWTPSSGTDNALMVDETAPDDDTTYNAAATVGLTDTHVTQDAPVVGAAIFGIQHCLSMKKSDAGACTVSPVIRHSSVDYPGAALSPSTAYAYSLQVAQVNPGTSAQWTEADFNAAEFGYKRVS